jgi:tetratricopeptide (TPR) repeat protein
MFAEIPGSCWSLAMTTKHSKHNLLPKSLGLLMLLVSLAGCNLGANQSNIAGNQAFQNGNYLQAISRFQNALAQNPNNPDANYNLAAIFYSMGKNQGNAQYLSQAEQLYRKAISLNGQHTEAHRGLTALLIETGREQFAFDLLDGWKDRLPNSAEPLIELARVYQEYGDNQHATDLLADALKVEGNNVRALKAMGRMRESQGQNLLALDNYMRVLQLDGSQTDVAQRVASLQQQYSQVGGNPNQNYSPRYGSTTPWQTR